MQQNDFLKSLRWAELMVLPHYPSGPLLEPRVLPILFGGHFKCISLPTDLKIGHDYFFTDIISISQMRKWRLRKVIINNWHDQGLNSGVWEVAFCRE